MVRGELIVDARGPEWRARIAGYEVPWSTPEGMTGGKPECRATESLTQASLKMRDYYAAGDGGQYVLVLPDLDMVVGITG